MKKIKILSTIILLVVISTMMYKPILIRADSGFDASYDSGGSSYSGDSYGDSSIGNVDFSHPVTGLVVLIFFVIIFIITILKLRTLNVPNYTMSIDDIHSKIPNFDIEQFNKKVFDNYKAIQIAWMNFELENIRDLISDEIFNMYSMQLETLKVKGQKNMMENIEYISNAISDIKIENDNIAITTLLQVSCNDYIVDEKNNVVRGKKNQKMYYKYKLTFTKSNSENIKYCPNCGAHIYANSSVKCEYCNAIIVNNEIEWIMTKKQMLSQREL